jgi:hypothetical protein
MLETRLAGLDAQLAQTEGAAGLVDVVDLVVVVEMFARLRARDDGFLFILV